MRLVVAKEVGSQDVLGLRAYEDAPFSAVVLCLVRLGRVAPYLFRGIDVAGTQDAKLARAASR